MADHDTHDHTGITGVTSTTVATDTIFNAKGDLPVGTGSDTSARLAIGANDTIPMADSGETTGIKWVASQTPSTQAFSDAAAQGTADTYARGDHKHGMPASPGGGSSELNYVAFTSPVTISGTTEGGANTIVTSGSVAFNGSTVALIEFFCPNVETSSTTNAFIVVLLYEDSTLLGQWGVIRNMGASTMFSPMHLTLRRTPSNASHTFTVKAYTNTGTGAADAGTGGTGAYTAGYVRITTA